MPQVWYKFTFRGSDLWGIRQAWFIWNTQTQVGSILDIYVELQSLCMKMEISVIRVPDGTGWKHILVLGFWNSGKPPLKVTGFRIGATSQNRPSLRPVAGVYTCILVPLLLSNCGWSSKGAFYEQTKLNWTTWLLKYLLYFPLSSTSISGVSVSIFSPAGLDLCG